MKGQIFKFSIKAESLGCAWQDLHNLLERRRAIVDKNFLFQGHLQVFKLDDTFKKNEIQATQTYTNTYLLLGFQ